MRTPRIRCKKCNRSVLDTFHGKWRHMVSRHPETFVSRFAPFIEKPDEALAVGRKLGEMFKAIVRLGE
jgi:hypothetical protein